MQIVKLAGLTQLADSLGVSTYDLPRALTPYLGYTTRCTVSGEEALLQATAFGPVESFPYTGLSVLVESDIEEEALYENLRNSPNALMEYNRLYPQAPKIVNTGEITYTLKSDNAVGVSYLQDSDPTSDRVNILVDGEKVVSLITDHDPMFLPEGVEVVGPVVTTREEDPDFKLPAGTSL